MFVKNTFFKSKSADAIKLATGVFALAVVSFFVASYLIPTYAAENALSIKGKVVAFDRFGGTLTIKPIGTDSSSAAETSGELTFTTSDTSSVTMCTMNKDLRDIRVGENVDVTYHGKDGNFFADAIDISTPVFACYTEYE